MKKNKMLQLLEPNVKTVYNGNERITYVDVPEDMPSDCLRKDIKNGAPLKAIQEGIKNDSRFNIILARTKEDGLRAVEYMHNDYIANGGVDIEADYEDDEYDILDDLFGDESDGPQNANIVEDSVYHIPVLYTGEIINYTRAQAGFEFNTNAFPMQGISTRPANLAPYWVGYKNSVCIITEERPEFFDSEDDSEFMFYIDKSIFHRFDSNPRVYYVIVTDKVPKKSFSLMSLCLEFTGNRIDIVHTDDVYEKYQAQLLENIVYQHNRVLDDEVDKKALTRAIIKIEKNNPCHTAAKVMDYLDHTKQKRVINKEMLKNFGMYLDEPLEYKKCAEEILNQLVGMNALKGRILSCVKNLRYNRELKRRGLTEVKSSMVYMFIGAPGTAKTTVAQMLAKALEDEELLPSNGLKPFVSISGAQLMAPYVGQTSHLVSNLFSENACIFIDEAYALTSNDSRGMNSFAQEAMAQLCVELEKHAHDRLVIFAGYGGKDAIGKGNKMKEFIEANPGIKSRIADTIVFDSYNAEEMLGIVHGIASSKKLNMVSDCDDLIRTYFEERCKDESFGNGREARRLVELAYKNMTSRRSESNLESFSTDELVTIEKCDVEGAIKLLWETDLQQQGRAKEIGFKMAG